MTAMPAFKAPDGFFERVEHAVLETPRGRWFLAEHARRHRAADTTSVLGAIERMQERIAKDLSALQIDFVRRELQDMQAAILQTRAEISQLRPADGDNNRIMMATEELDAIVTATERATSDILGAAERTQELVGKLRAGGAHPGLCDEIDAAQIDIFTACSFQDITGQRTNKVVNVLRYLENRVHALIAMWAEGPQAAARFSPTDERPDAHLMNGPAREGEGVGQDDVDRLLNGDFGAAEVDEAEPPAPAPAPAPKLKAAPAPAAEGPKSSQADIDALFD